jgi:hypothetical protein
VEYELGQSIDWDAELTSVILFVELPFWLMTPSYTFNVEVLVEADGHPAVLPVLVQD